MRAGIDLRQLRQESSGGIVQLTEGLSLALFRLAPEESFFVYYSVSGYCLPGPFPENVEATALPDDNDPARLDAALARDRADVLLRAYPIDDELAFPLRRHFVLVPDLQHEDYPDFFADEERVRRRQAFDKAIDRAGAVGLLSNHTLERLRALFPDAGARRVLVPPGQPSLAQALATPLSEAESRAVPDGPFFLYPANLWPHKNHRRLIEAFERFIARRSQSVSLVLTGDPSGAAELLAEFPFLPIHHLGFVGPRLLAELYRRCIALTYFSLYEGFGIPLLEAFQLGAPVLCSNTTSLAEVGGDAVLRCDPTDISAMAELMERVAGSPELRVVLQSRGQVHLKPYDWAQSAGNLLHTLRALAGQPAAHEDVLNAVRVLTERTVEELRSTLAERTAWAERMVAEAEQRDVVIEELRLAVAERTAWAERMVAEAEQRGAVIEELQAALAARRRFGWRR